MTDLRITRRNAIAAGCLFVAGSGCASPLTSTEDSRSPGADDFTAGTVPAESDPVLALVPDDVRADSAATTVATQLLDGPSFADLPTRVAHLVREPSSAIDSAPVGKVVVIGSNAGSGSGAVIWAEWSEDDLLDMLPQSGQGTLETQTYDGRTIHKIGERAGVRLAEQVFTVGTSDIVRSVVDVWHGDGDPVSAAVLRPFERTDREAPVRFATTGLAFHADSTPPRTTEYAPVANTSVSIATADRESTVNVAYAVDSINAAKSLGEALERDLGIESVSGAVEPALPRGIRRDLAVDRTGTVVTLRYRDGAETVAEYGGDVITAVAAATGAVGERRQPQ